MLYSITFDKVEFDLDCKNRSAFGKKGLGSIPKGSNSYCSKAEVQPQILEWNKTNDVLTFNKILKIIGTKVLKLT